MTKMIRFYAPKEWKEQIDKEITKEKMELGIRNINKSQWMKNNMKLIKMPKELKNAIKKN